MTTMLEKMADSIQVQTDCQCRASALAAARAALQAIREPDEKITEAGESLAASDGYYTLYADPDVTFTAMIDAILAEKDAA